MYEDKDYQQDDQKDDNEDEQENTLVCAFIGYVLTRNASSCSLTPRKNMKGLLEILASSTEHVQPPIRPGEETVVQSLIDHQRCSCQNQRCNDPYAKANTFLEGHFSRQSVVEDLALDQ